MLNINTLTQVKKLLDDYTVYKYEDTTTSEEINGETVITIVESALEKFEADIQIIADEVYISTMLTIIDEGTYNYIKAMNYSEYTLNFKRLFYAECYFIASKFLKAWSLKNETELYKSNYDLTTKVFGTQKSGKLFTADEYYKTAMANVAEYEKDSTKVDNQSMVWIRRY